MEIVGTSGIWSKIMESNATDTVKYKCDLCDIIIIGEIAAAYHEDIKHDCEQTCWPVE